MFPYEQMNEEGFEELESQRLAALYSLHPYLDPSYVSSDPDDDDEKVRFRKQYHAKHSIV